MSLLPSPTAMALHAAAQAPAAYDLRTHCNVCRSPATGRPMGALLNICSAPGCLDAAMRWDGRTPLVPTASLVVAPPAPAAGITARDRAMAQRAAASLPAVGGAGAPPAAAPAAAPPTPLTSVSAASVVKELGEIRRIGHAHTLYFIKDGEVFDIDTAVVNRLCVGVQQEVSKKDRLSTFALIRSPRGPRGERCGQMSQDFSCFTADEIRTFRGPRVFSSTNEAEAHWEALRVAAEDAEIIAEARRRLAEEQRVAAAADAVAAREARILTAMQNIRV